VQGVDPWMSFVGEPTQERDQWRLEVDQVQTTMQHVHEHLRVEMRGSQAVQEEGANRGCIPAPNIQVGSKVWLDARNIRTTRPTRKLDWKRLGPFQLKRQVSPYAYELELPASIRIHRVQPVSCLDVVVEDPLVGQRVEPPPSVEVDGEEEYQVLSVEDSRVYQNRLQYLIRWTGNDSLTWEPAKCVDGLQGVEEFHQQYSGKPGPLENALRGPRA
jgi:hypothetical protein